MLIDCINKCARLLWCFFYRLKSIYRIELYSFIQTFILKSNYPVMKTKQLYAIATFCLGLFIAPNINAQEDETQIKDIRNARWGMGKEELIAKEAKADRYNKPKVDGNLVRFENQDLGKGYRADITYKFMAGRLLKIEYRVFYTSENVVGSCKNIIPFRDKIMYSEHVFKELEETLALRCAAGWYFNDTINLRDYTYKVDDDYNCKRDGKLLVELARLANKYQYHNIHMEMLNKRTKAHFKFNEWQNNKDAFIEELGYTPKCEDEIYNTYYWITFEPNAVLKEGISNTAMSIEDLEGTSEELESETDKKEKKAKKTKKEKKKTVEDEPLTPTNTPTNLEEGAELPETLEETDKKAKKIKKAKKEKSKKKKKSDEDE